MSKKPSNTSIAKVKGMVLLTAFFLVFVLSAIIITINQPKIVIGPRVAVKAFYNALSSQDAKQIADTMYPKDSSEWQSFVGAYGGEYSQLANYIFYEFEMERKRIITAHGYLHLQNSNNLEEYLVLPLHLYKLEKRWYVSSNSLAGIGPINPGQPIIPGPSANALRLEKNDYTTFTIPANSIIDSFTFKEQTKLKELRLSKDMQQLDAHWFENCLSLERVIAHADSPHFSSVDGVLYNRDMTELAYYPIGKKHLSFSLPNKVTSIRERAFYKSELLRELRLSPHLITIKGQAFYSSRIEKVVFNEGLETLGDKAFYDCTELKEVHLPASLTSIGNNCFEKSLNIHNFIIPTASKLNHIGRGAFMGCETLTNLILPSGIATIEESTFEDCKNLITINIDHIKRIEKYAFYRCHNLKSLYLHSNIQYIGLAAFAGCANLELSCYATSAPTSWHARWDNNLYNPCIWGVPVKPE